MQQSTTGWTARWFPRTIGGRIAETGGYASGFDYMRVVLAVLVVLGHSFLISGDRQANVIFPFGLNQIRSYGVLSMFFCLSGFLVAASLMRVATLKVFLGLRVLRIFPALCVEIALSALLLGPILTTVSLGEYFTSSEFFIYFTNMAGWIHYHLPGVFLDHPVERVVNGSLWTVPYEAECYIVLALLAVAGIKKYPRLFLAIFLALTIAACVYFAMTVDPDPRRSTASGRQLVLFFVAGVLTYLLKDDIPYSGWVAAAAAVVIALTITSHSLIYLAPLPMAYITAYLGLMQPKKLPLLFTGDYSYGIYLYAYPLQQATYQLFPAGSIWWANFLIALAAVSVFAAFSWHAIEKPMLKLKRYLLTRADRAGKKEMISPDKTRTEVAEAGDEPTPAAQATLATPAQG